MEIAVSDAKAQLTDLVRRAEAGEDIVLTRHGQAVARLTPVIAKPDAEAKWRVIQAIRQRARARELGGESAARSADFLDDEFGLPK